MDLRPWLSPAVPLALKNVVLAVPLALKNVVNLSSSLSGRI